MKYDSVMRKEDYSDNLWGNLISELLTTSNYINFGKDVNIILGVDDIFLGVNNNA